MPAPSKQQLIATIRDVAQDFISAAGSHTGADRLRYNTAGNVCDNGADYLEQVTHVDIVPLSRVDPNWQNPDDERGSLLGTTRGGAQIWFPRGFPGALALPSGIIVWSDAAEAPHTPEGKRQMAALALHELNHVYAGFPDRPWERPDFHYEPTIHAHTDLVDGDNPDPPLITQLRERLEFYEGSVVFCHYGRGLLEFELRGYLLQRFVENPPANGGLGADVRLRIIDTLLSSALYRPYTAAISGAAQLASDLGTLQLMVEGYRLLYTRGLSDDDPVSRNWIALRQELMRASTMLTQAAAWYNRLVRGAMQLEPDAGDPSVAHAISRWNSRQFFLEPL